MSYETWERIRLGDIAKLRNGFAFSSKDFKDFGTPVIKIKNVKPNQILLNDLSYVDPVLTAKLDRFIINKGDILITMSGNRMDGSPDSWVGKVAMFDRDGSFLLNQRVGIIDVLNAEIDKTFLTYVLSSFPYQHHFILAANSSGGQANISPSGILNTEFDVPDLATQQRIAAILSSFDDKIVLNRRMNQTLEEMARAVFREWFVNFNYPGADGVMEDGLPEGWRMGTLGEVCETVRSSVQPKDVAVRTPYVGLEHIPRKSLTLTEWGTSEDVDSQKARFRKGDILFGKLRPYFHKVAIAPTDGICSTDILVFRPLVQSHYSFVLNHLFSESLITYVSGIADATRMPRVDWRSVANYQIAVPPNDLLTEYDRAVRPFYTKLVDSIFETQTLAMLRDILLPKLMKGEIIV